MTAPPLPDAQTRIRLAMAASGAAVLDRPVLWDQGSPGVRRIFDLVGVGSRRSVYLDVPVTAVVALGRSRLIKPGATWRRIVDEHLTDDTWTDRVFDYIESEIRKQRFPAKGADGVLMLDACGGAVACSNGNHRLAAAIAWLAARHGDDAVLRKVVTNVVSLDNAIAGPLLAAHARGARVALACHPTDGALLCRVRTTWRVSITVFRRDAGPEGRWGADRSQTAGKLPEESWETVPATVLDAWRDAHWLSTQLASPTLEPVEQEGL
ncbi:hypothetical protein FHW79_006401 [Azospirillum sp. OGB3]|uniref:hypothetical protein n=1 Tax=Azospirillum sp. OGB3 TaxID=2587012 RepID=UPI00160596AD|nr:hypothetical protein [Azospirillum sp. OGB3]MBB3268726.1 hypothetical protein [Azospirillum sp. OGB3]